MLLYATLLLCTAVIGTQVYRYDLYDREPPHAILLTMLLGGIGLYAAGLLQIAFMTSMGESVAEHWNLWMAAAAGITEELAKIAVVALIAILRPKWFNDPLDGAIYGSFSGLGAAVYESLVHLGFPSFEHLPHLLPASEPVRLMGHLIMGGIGGFGVGFIQASQLPRRSHWLVGCMSCSIVLHTAWDVIAFDAADRGRMLPWHTAISILLMIGGMLAFRILIRIGAEHSRRWAQGQTEPGTTISP